VYFLMPLSGVFQKIVCPMKPSSYWEASSDSSSSREWSGAKRRQTIAWKQESQYHCQG
jgi:hypothetical protein